MRRKIILSTTIVSIAIALAIFCVGVYASMTQEFSMTNTIGFVSTSNVYFSFDGEISNCVQTQDDVWQESGAYQTKDEYLFAKGLKYSQKFKEEDRLNADLPTSYIWTITEPIEYIDSKTAIVYTFVLSNYSEVKTKLSLSFKQNGTNIKNQVVCNISNNARVSSGNGEVIENYTGIQEIILDEYVVGQSEKPAQCVFTITATVSGNIYGIFEEENNFTISAEKLG